jgi:PAS domain S-box-containing protein
LFDKDLDAGNQGVLMRVRDILQSPMAMLSTTDTLRDAACLFRRQEMQGAQVVDDRQEPQGVFTHEELLHALANGAKMSETVVGHMRTVFSSVHADTDVSAIDWQGGKFLAVTDNGDVIGGLDTMAVLKALHGVKQPEDLPCGDILQGLPEPLFLLDDAWTIDWCNAAAGLLCGMSAQELRGRGLAQALGAAGFNLETDPADERSIHMAWRDSARLLPIMWRIDPHVRSSGRMVLLRNVQEQMTRFQELTELRNHSKELNAIIDSSFDGFYVTDGQGRTLYINRAYERITGINAKEVIGRTMSDLVAEGFYNESVTLKVLKTRRTETIIQKVKDTKTIVVTGNPIFDQKGGIWRVVTNVRDVTELRKLQLELERMARLKSHYRRELDNLRKRVDNKSKVIIRSKKMQEVCEQAMRLAQVDSTVLISGESGVGKEVVAELIHNSSTRSDYPFVKVSCAAIPEHLLESELFGYTPGAFTGALDSGKQGLFEVADKGTLFLDEIGEMPLGIQAKMLRILQDKTFTRVGGSQNIRVDVRIIAATNRNLEEMVGQKAFRSDLFYRLNVVPVRIPPLRERREAIFDFVYHFLGRFNQKHGLSRQIEGEAMDILISLDWPGNVRELENTVERLVVMSKGDVISRPDVQNALGLNSLDDHHETAGPQKELPLKDMLHSVEKQALSRALKKHKSTRAAARALGVDQSTIVRKMQRHGLKPG